MKFRIVTLVTAMIAALVIPAAAWSAPGDPPDPALAAKVAAWVSGGGSADLTALGADFTALEAAANANDLDRMGTTCGALLADVRGAQGHDPIPDPAAQKDWSAALDLYAAGATDCSTGAGRSDVDLITQASDEIIQGSQSLDRVTARLKAISGG